MSEKLSYLGLENYSLKKASKLYFKDFLFCKIRFQFAKCDLKTKSKLKIFSELYFCEEMFLNGKKSIFGDLRCGLEKYIIMLGNHSKNNKIQMNGALKVGF